MASFSPLLPQLIEGKEATLEESLSLEAIFQNPFEESAFLLLSDHSVYLIDRDWDLLQVGDRLKLEGDRLHWLERTVDLQPTLVQVKGVSRIKEAAPLPVYSSEMGEEGTLFRTAVLENNEVYAIACDSSQHFNWQRDDLLFIIKNENTEYPPYYLLNISQGSSYSAESNLLGQATHSFSYTGCIKNGKKMELEDANRWNVAPFCQERARSWSENEPLLLIDHCLTPQEFLGLEETLFDGTFIDDCILEEWVEAWHEWLFGEDLKLRTVLNVARQEIVHVWILESDLTNAP
jgi:hypothetical protein